MEVMGRMLQGKSPCRGDPKAGRTPSNIKLESLAWTLVGPEMILHSPTWTFIAFGCYWRPLCTRKSRAAWRDSTHLSSLSIAGDLVWIMWTWQDPSLTIESLGLNSRAIYSVPWKPLWIVCISGCLQGQDCTHWLMGGKVKLTCLPENRIRGLRDSLFDVLFLILTKIPYCYWEGNALQSMKNYNYRIAVCSGWACKLLPCFK